MDNDISRGLRGSSRREISEDDLRSIPDDCSIVPEASEGALGERSPRMIYAASQKYTKKYTKKASLVKIWGQNTPKIEYPHKPP